MKKRLKRKKLKALLLPYLPKDASFIDASILVMNNGGFKSLLITYKYKDITCQKILIEASGILRYNKDNVITVGDDRSVYDLFALIWYSTEKLFADTVILFKTNLCAVFTNNKRPMDEVFEKYKSSIIKFVNDMTDSDITRRPFAGGYQDSDGNVILYMANEDMILNSSYSYMSYLEYPKYGNVDSVKYRHMDVITTLSNYSGKYMNLKMEADLQCYPHYQRNLICQD